MKSLLLKLVKALARRAVVIALNALKAHVLKAFAAGGARAIDVAFDGAQGKLVAGLEWMRIKSWTPAWVDSFLKYVEAEVFHHGDALQEKVKAVAKEKGPAGIEAAFAAAKVAMLEAIAKAKP